MMVQSDISFISLRYASISAGHSDLFIQIWHFYTNWSILIHFSRYLLWAWCKSWEAIVAINFDKKIVFKIFYTYIFLQYWCIFIRSAEVLKILYIFNVIVTWKSGCLLHCSFRWLVFKQRIDEQTLCYIKIQIQ